MTTLENLTFPGFLAVYNIANLEKGEDGEDGEDEDSGNKNVKVPEIGVELDVDNISGSQDYTRPPGRYNQASLIDKLDPKNLNIGRPATYVSIIEKIIERDYVKVADLEGKEVDSLLLSWNPKVGDNTIKEEQSTIVLGKEKGKYVPTKLGIMVTYYLIKNFPKIMDYQFTAQMEEKLDDIASGDLVWHNVIKEFYDEFHPMVMKITFQKPEIEEKYTKLLGIDPKTGFEVYATLGKYGPIYKLMSKHGKPKAAPIKEPLTLETATLEDAIKRFEYPKELGKYGGKKILLQTGEFGFYLIFGTQRITVQDKKDITLNEAIEVIKSKEKTSLASFKSGTREYSILDGKFGKYVCVNDTKTKKKFNVSLPKNENVDKLTVERINEILSLKFKKPIAKQEQKTSIVAKVPVKKVVNKKVIKKVVKKANKKNIDIE